MPDGVRHPDGEADRRSRAKASGGNSGQDDPAAAGALDVDPGRRQAPALDHRRAPHPGRRPCRRTPRQSRPPLPSSKRLPGTSVSLPGITLSDKGGQGERAHCRRSGASTGRPVWPSRPRRNGNSVASASRCVARSRWRAPGRDRTPDFGWEAVRLPRQGDHSRRGLLHVTSDQPKYPLSPVAWDATGIRGDRAGASARVKSGSPSAPVRWSRRRPCPPHQART